MKKSSPLLLGINSTLVLLSLRSRGNAHHLGKFETWKENGEQVYAGGSEEHCTSPRSFVVQFTCEKAVPIFDTLLQAQRWCAVLMLFFVTVYSCAS